ncbi:MAG: hypothetical protein FWD01_00905 [Defluviitaleaceae bacterium]|nr:hypothetical protein [Defluviitaleaceae bacterium]
MSKEVKKYLKRIFEAGKIEEAMREKLEIMRSRQESPGGGSYGFGGVKTSRRKDALGDLAAAILDFENKLARYSLKLIRDEAELKRILDLLKDGTQKAIMTWRYICRFSWEEISNRSNLSVMQLTRIHNAAIIAVAAIFENSQPIFCK